MNEETRNCPTCGQSVAVGAAYCGYCGHDFSASSSGPSGFTPMTPTYTTVSSGGGFGWIKWLIIFITVATVGGTVAIFAFVGNEVDNVIDQVNIPDFNVNGPGGSSDALTGPGSFKTGKALVAALNDGGFDCKRYNLITENQSLEAGTCFAGAESVSIQVYYDKLSFDSVVSNYISNDSIHIAYGKNWTVLVQTPKSAKKAAKALDGKVG